MNKIKFTFRGSAFLLCCVCLLTSCANSKNSSSNNKTDSNYSSQVFSSSSDNTQFNFSSTNNKNVTTSVGKNLSRIEYNEAGHDVTITNSTDVSNIISLMKSMKKVSTENKIAKCEGVKVYFIQNDLKKTFVVSEQGAFFDGYYHEGLTQGIAIEGILNKYTYDRKYIIDKIKGAKEITLLAKDQNVSKEIKNKDALIEAIEGSNSKYSDEPDSIAADFPNYHLILTTAGKKLYDIAILDKNNFFVDSSDSEIAEERYKSNKKIWVYVSRLIPAVAEKDINHISYLFQSSKAIVMDGYNKGDYTNRLNSIVRILLDGVKQNSEKSSSAGKRSVSLSFVVDKKTYNVAVYQNGFTYNRNFYLKKDIGSELENLISVG